MSLIPEPADDSHKIILDLCGGTGAWSKPYKDAGYDVRIVTLPDQDVLTYEPPAGVYGILAAPPCTEFSLAKGARPRNLEVGMAVVAACMRIIWHCRLNGSLKFWAIENPRGLLRQFLGKPAMTFEQWQYGSISIKPTDLWGYFKAPAATVQQKPQKLEQQHKYQHRHGVLMSNPTCPQEYADLGLDRAAIRAITPQGFARAFFQANSKEATP